MHIKLSLLVISYSVCVLSVKHSTNSLTVLNAAILCHFICRHVSE